MADDEEDEPIEEPVEGPGKEWEIYEKSEDMVDKLKLLDYEIGFLGMSKTYRPIQRHYFVNSTNVGEQFYLFTSLAAWLIKVGGNSSYEMPQEFDDPNSTINNIVSELRAKGVPIDFPANKLKAGAGEQALYVLDQLADLALVHTNFRWNKMIPPVEEDEDVNIDSDHDDESDGVADDEPDFAEDDDDNAILVDLAAPSVAPTQNDEQPLQDILKSDVDVAAWKAEVERVAPLLKITLAQDGKDWRMHLEQVHTMQKNMEELVVQVTPQLEEVSSELDKSLERIDTREKNLNKQLNVLIEKFRKSKDERAASREKYKSASVGITERNATFQRINEDLEQLKQQIEEEGAKNSDGAPMVKVKQALVKIEEDIMKMNVQIAVIEQTLLSGQLRERIAYAAEAYGTL